MSDPTHRPDDHVLPVHACYAGALVGVTGNVVHGWAMDRHEPDARVVVEILVDGQSSGLCVANQVQTAGDGTGDGLHGFSATLPERTLREAQRVDARVANHAAALGDPFFLARSIASAPAVSASLLQYGGGLTINGWLWDPDDPGRQLSVVARKGRQLVARTRADRPHPALVQLASAEHGFLLELPWWLGDGDVHEIDVTDESGRPLAGSPILVCYQPGGISGLLRQVWPRAQNRQPIAPDAFDALVRLTAARERCTPLPIGFGHYAEWFPLHEQRLSAMPPSTSNVRVAILVDGGADAALAQTSAETARQRHRPTTIGIVQADLRAGIQDAIASGAAVIVPVSAGDSLSPAYVDHVLAVLASTGAAWVYTDCDQLDADGVPGNPWLKPAWDPDLFLAMDVVTAGSAWKTDVLQAALARFPAAALPDWQCVSVLMAQYLHEQQKLDDHVVRTVGVLYHRSARAPSQPYEHPRSSVCVELLGKYVHALAPHARLQGIPDYPGLHRVTWPLPEQLPLVSLIVPTRDQYALLRTCIDGLLNQTDYPNVEIIVVDNQSSDPKTIDYLHALTHHGVRVLPYPHPFNYSAINNFAVGHARGELIGLINNDIEIKDAAWLREMVSQASRPGVGAVGMKLLWKNGMVQHGGVVVDVCQAAVHIGTTSHATDPGYLGMGLVNRRQSAVTAACMLLRKDVFIQAGALDEDRFPVNFNDVDLCLRLRHRMKRAIVFTASVQNYHVESASRGADVEQFKRFRALREWKNLRAAWLKEQSGDPFYHPNLSLHMSISPYESMAN